MPGEIPQHLQKYIVKQEIESYSSRDHAVWRYSMRQLKNFLSVNAHESYLDGLVKTGIEINEIPSIESIDTKLRQFGWGAIPVSGFIPPTAFMEFQSLGFLPIASGIRSLETILYTPAPDIIHEAAGHAPIIANPDFSQYLKNYAEVANKSILNKSDIDLYDAIRELSDLKEHPNSTEDEIKNSELRLQKVSENMGPPSEASILGRMNWWTAEYGLIGNKNSPKIFGAGILSSIGEAEECLKPNVKKLPLTIKCIDYSYDITEQQPQLFITPSFEHLSNVLNQLSEMMAYKMGGHTSVDKAIKSETVNTFQLNTGIQVSGLIEKQIIKNDKTIFIKTSGPTQLSTNNQQLESHNKEAHPEGYSTIVDTINNQCLSEINFDKIGLKVGASVALKFDSGFTLTGLANSITRNNSDLPIVIQFSNCTVTYDGQEYFKPDWGVFDLAVGSSVTSVFGGPADTKSYGELYNFTAQTIPTVKYSANELKIFDMYTAIRSFRNSHKDLSKLNTLISSYITEFSNEWLMGIELLEILENFFPNEESSKSKILSQLEVSSRGNNDINTCITKGISLSKMPIIN